MSEPFLGELRCFGFNFPPSGWAECNGQTLQISQNTALFSLFGTMYGGNGETTFRIPELRGRAPIHHGDNPSLPNVAQGQALGAATTTLTTANIPNHSHAATLKAAAGNASGTSPTGNGLAAAREDTYGPLDGSTDVSMHASSIETAAVGGGQSFDNYSPSLALNWCVALQGIFPSN